MNRSVWVFMASLVIIALSVRAAGSYGTPPMHPGTHTLEIVVSGLVVCVDETDFLRLIFPEFRKYGHYAFMQFRRGDLVDPKTVNDRDCQMVLNGAETCTIRISGGHVFDLDDGMLTGPALNNISTALAGVVPASVVSGPAAKLGPTYDKDPIDPASEAARLDLGKGVLCPQMGPFKWDFKINQGSPAKVSLCTAELVKITESVNVAHAAFDGFVFKIPDNGKVQIRLGNMMPNDEAEIPVNPKPSPDVHFEHFFDAIPWPNPHLVPFLSSVPCKPSDCEGAKTPGGSNCPPILIKH